jgi:hypothetical protein
MLAIYEPKPTHPTDVVSYSRPLDDGTFFVIVRHADGSNPRTLILRAAQLATLQRAA